MSRCTVSSCPCHRPPQGHHSLLDSGVEPWVCEAEVLLLQEASEAGWVLGGARDQTGTHTWKVTQHGPFSTIPMLSPSTLVYQLSTWAHLRGSENWPLWADKETEAQSEGVCSDGTEQSQDLHPNPRGSSFSAHFSVQPHSDRQTASNVPSF